MTGIMQMFFNAGNKNNNFIGLLGASVQTYGKSVAVDTNGNIYVCGYSGGQDIQVAKYNAGGNLQWQETLVGSEYGYGITVDSSGNVYVCGDIISSGYDAQIVKFDTSGVIQWQRKLSSSGADRSYGITVDSSNNVYVCGSSNSNLNILLAKYNSSGIIQWQRQLTDATNTNIGRSVSVDTSGNVYICGQSNATGWYLFVIAKYNSSGVIQWQRRLGTAGGDNYGSSVSTDSSGNVYVCGASNAVSGNQDIIIAKYNSSGVIQWQRRLSASTSDFGYGVSTDSSGNVYVCGISGSPVMIQIAKYDSSGTIQWQRQLGNVNGNNGFAITTDTQGHIYVCGDTVPNGSYNNLFIAKLPSDGTSTGTYSVGGYSFTYSASSLTDAAASLTESAATLTDSASTLTDSVSTLTASASSLTSSVTVIP